MTQNDFGISSDAENRTPPFAAELSLAEMLADPIVQIMMTQDRVEPASIIEIVRTARRNLARP